MKQSEASPPPYFGNIFLIEDDPANRISLEEILAREQYTVSSAESGSEALNKLSDSMFCSSIDVIISDLKLPDTPSDFLSQLRHLAPDAELIILTAFPSLPTALESIHLHYFGYLTKPCSTPALLDLVSAAVKKAESYRAIKLHMKALAERQRRVFERSQELLNTISKSHSALHASSASIADNVSTMVRLIRTRLTSQTAPDKEVSTLTACPKLDGYQELLKETIKTLDKTKGSFRSKTLGDLRMKLEKYVD